MSFWLTIILQQLYNSERLDCEACSSSLCDRIYKHVSSQCFCDWRYWFYANFLHFSPTKADFIRAKHQMLAFVFRPGKDDTLLLEDDLSRQLHSSVRTSNLETSLRLLSQGADPNYFHEVHMCIHMVSITLYKNFFGQHPQALFLWVKYLEHEGEYARPSRGKVYAAVFSCPLMASILWCLGIIYVY